MKKFVAVLIIMAIMAAGWNVYAYNYPSNFWEVNSKYENAINSNNHNAIIEYGNKIINLMNSAAEGPEKRNILVTRYNQVGYSYAALGDYDNAAKMFKTLYYYATQFGDEFYDYIKASKARYNQ